MPIRLLATALADGWAVVDYDQRIILLRPPYRHSLTQEIPPSKVDEIIARGGFTRTEQTFENWTDLIEFLTDAYRAGVAARCAQLRQLSSIEDIVRASSPEDAGHYIATIETELLPTGEVDAAEALLALLFEADSVQRDAALHTRCVQALRRLHATRGLLRTRVVEAINSEAAIKESAPRASEQFTSAAILELTVDISSRGQIWSLGA